VKKQLVEYPPYIPTGNVTLVELLLACAWISWVSWSRISSTMDISCGKTCD